MNRNENQPQFLPWEVESETWLPEREKSSIECVVSHMRERKIINRDESLRRSVVNGKIIWFGENFFEREFYEKWESLVKYESFSPQIRFKQILNILKNWLLSENKKFYEIKNFLEIKI